MYMKCHRKLERHGVTGLEINCKEVMTLQTLHCPVVTARLCRQIQRSLIFYTWCRGHKFGLVSYVSLFQNKRQPTLPEHPSTPPVFSGVRVTRSLVLCVCFVDRCLSFCTFSFGHCVVCSSSIYELWLPLWYLQTLLRENRMGNQEWTIQRHWRHWAHKTLEEDKHNTKTQHNTLN